MSYDPEEHHRRSIRLDTYDYAKPGAYFVTICAEDHLSVFGRIVGEEMKPNGAGRMIQAVWTELPDHYPGVAVDAFLVMPNHIHGIIVLLPVGAGPRACPDSNLCMRLDDSAHAQEGQP